MTIDHSSGTPPPAPSFERACEFDRLGRTDDAKQEYLAVLLQDPVHFRALNNLGALLNRTGYRSAAATTFREAVRLHPGNPIGHVNLGNLLFAAGELAAARHHFETALSLAPDLEEAHRGFAYLLADCGDDRSAEIHRRAAYRSGAIAVQPFRGLRPGIPLLLLVSAVGGNVPTRFLIDDTIFEVTVIATEFYDPTAPLPPHRLIFNAVGDPDLSPRGVTAATEILATSTAPVINAPEIIMATGRAAIARRLSGIPGVITPRIASFSRAMFEGSDPAAILAEQDFAFPLLIRSPGHHTGRNFVRIETPASLPEALAMLPGDPLMAIEPLDTRGTDGLVRKYRVMMIGGELYPLHLAISEHWKVHYFSADMADHPEHRAEEAEFLADMPGVLGPLAIIGLEHIRDTLGLDYGGVDFGLGRNGEVLVFEANATMVVNPPDPDPRWAYRREPIERALRAARELIARRAKI